MLDTANTVQNGAEILKRFKVSDNHYLVLCYWKGNHDPYVVWRSSKDGYTYWGHYHRDFDSALETFNKIGKSLNANFSSIS